MKKTAILIDGGFYRKRAFYLMGEKTPKDRIDELMKYCMRHLRHKYDNKDDLYRIFYYDCPPFSGTLYHPYLKEQVDFKKTDIYKWNNEFLSLMMKRRHVALRLGTINESQSQYMINPKVVRKILNGSLTLDDIKDTDFIPDIKQKGVDMKIGVDIASLAYKKQVDRIILIAGDSDFVPAAKLARREGIDFILDPMWIKIKPDLFEHIDGLITKAPRPKNESQSDNFIDF